MRTKFCILLVVSIVYTTIANGSDLYTGMEGMNKLSNTEDSVVEVLEDIMEDFQSNLRQAKVLLEHFKKENSDTLENSSVAGFVEHPINLYHSVKKWRHVNEWLITQQAKNQQDLDCLDVHQDCQFWAETGECQKNPAYMLQSCSLSCGHCKKLTAPDNNPLYTILQTIENLTMQKLPDQEDLRGAAEAVLRLQRTYNLSVDDISTGNISGHQVLQHLVVEDVYHIGKTAVQTRDWGLALQWLQRAKVSNTERTLDVLIDKELARTQIETFYYPNEFSLSQDERKIEVLLYLHINQMNDTIGANATILKALGHRPDMKQALWVDKQDKCESWAEAGECDKKGVIWKYHCRFSCNNTGVTNQSGFNVSQALINLYGRLLIRVKMVGWTTNSEFSRQDGEHWTSTYEELCRQQEIKLYHDAVCRYRKALLPYYTYKEEIISMNPRVALIYDVINDNEAVMIQNLAKAQLKRGKVGGKRIVSSSRISKVTFLSDNNPLINKLSRRIELITGLCLTVRKNFYQKSAEDLQVVDYGIGGHYEAHTDFFMNISNIDQNSSLVRVTQESGDRMATFLLYISSVLAGGGTVFPEIKVYIPPIKNAAAFWLNTKLSGEYDLKTLHLGCPVLLGHKWVANKWIREYGNEFRKRCSVEKDAKYS